MDESKCPQCRSNHVHEELVTIRVADEGGFKHIDTTIMHCSECGWWATPKERELQAEVERLRDALEAVYNGVTNESFLPGPVFAKVMRALDKCP